MVLKRKMLRALDDALQVLKDADKRSLSETVGDLTTIFKQMVIKVPQKEPVVHEEILD